MGHARWVAGRDHLLASHPESPIPPDRRDAFRGVPVAPYDPSLRSELAIDDDIEPTRLHTETGTDGVVAFDRIGRLHAPQVGDLDVWWLVGYGGGLFVPLKDATSGTETYGGGRYVIDSAKGADLGGDHSSLIIDFNFAYNPSCAYDPVWACPLPPPGNTVAVPVLAGELSMTDR